MPLRTLLLASLTVVLCAADGSPLAGCADTANWAFNNGQEFKGATGGIEKAEGGIALHYDFTAGGAYVDAIWKGAIPADLKQLTFTATADADTNLKFRVITDDKRCFQGFEHNLKAKAATTITVDLAGPWTQAWGGEEAKSPQKPVKSFSILATKKGSKSGTVVISNLLVTAK